MTEAEVSDEIRQILVAAKHRAGVYGIAFNNQMIDSAAPVIARLLVRMVAAATKQRAAGEQHGAGIEQ